MSLVAYTASCIQFFIAAHDHLPVAAKRGWLCVVSMIEGHKSSQYNIARNSFLISITANLQHDVYHYKEPTLYCALAPLLLYLSGQTTLATSLLSVLQLQSLGASFVWSSLAVPILWTLISWCDCPPLCSMVYAPIWSLAWHLCEASRRL